MKKLLFIFPLLLAGCQSTTRQAEPPRPTTSASTERVWLRLDGQRASGSPVLLAKFQKDKAACVKDVDFVSEAAEGCMKDRGYIFVPSSEAPRVAAQLAANARAR